MPVPPSPPSKASRSKCEPPWWLASQQAQERGWSCSSGMPCGSALGIVGDKVELLLARVGWAPGEGERVA